MRSNTKSILSALLISLLLVGSLAFPAFAQEDGPWQKNIPSERAGNTVSMTFQYTGDEVNEDTYFWIFNPDPFEDDTYPFENRKSGVGVLKKFHTPQTDTRSFTVGGVRIKKNLEEGYYNFKVYYTGDADKAYAPESADLPGGVHHFDARIYVKSAAASKDDTDKASPEVHFMIGEGQNTPYGKYPNPVNFSLNLRNDGLLGAQDVTVSLVCDTDSTKFPFDINEANYDRHYDYIGIGETVSLPYSFAIRSDVYSGYYAIKMKITYRENSGGELKTQETEFYVHVINKEKSEEGKNNEFNPNDRVKARLIVDSFRTVPEEIYAGTDFDVFITMKNASSDVDASNILFSFESEKVSESPVFTTKNGSNSLVLNGLKAGENSEIMMKFTAKAGIDQRAYAITINEKYDSPEFKNAEEKVSIDIPVKQIAKYNMGNVEIMPESIAVGDETNVMFPINNTGKVILYNVMVRFEAPSVQTSESYIGNIKPGETGNVDVMLRGAEPTADSGDIRVLISYEDENGVVTENTETINLYVSDMPDMTDMDNMDLSMPEEEKKPWYQTPWPYVGAGVLVLVIIIIVVIVQKKKKAAQINIDGYSDES